jgi:ABC-type nitrate/sulfonate/bicarbonate transport system substrate-binding protein
MRAIMEDRYALATTAFDNIVAYAEGQGEFAAPGFDLVAFLGVHSGLNSLIARPEIGTVEDLRGRTVAVDALGTGYAFLLFGLLEGRGLLPGRDYSVLSVGSGERRLEALESGKAQAALMSAPSDLRALASGCRMLGDATQVFGRYQGSVYAARRVFARNHADELARFARAIKGAHAAVYADPAGSLDILRARLQGVSDNDAARIYARLTSSAGGLAPEAETDVEGVRNVLALRARWSGRDWAPGDPAKYVERVA